MTDSWQKGNKASQVLRKNITKTRDASHAADNPYHQDAIISEKLKLLKISSLKAERKQAVVSVLNTGACLSGSAVLAAFVFLGTSEISIYASSIV